MAIKSSSPKAPIPNGTPGRKVTDTHNTHVHPDPKPSPSTTQDQALQDLANLVTQLQDKLDALQRAQDDLAATSAAQASQPQHLMPRALEKAPEPEPAGLAGALIAQLESMRKALESHHKQLDKKQETRNTTRERLKKDLETFLNDQAIEEAQLKQANKQEAKAEAMLDRWEHLQEQRARAAAALYAIEAIEREEIEHKKEEDEVEEVSDLIDAVQKHMTSKHGHGQGAQPAKDKMHYGDDQMADIKTRLAQLVSPNAATPTATSEQNPLNDQNVMGATSSPSSTPNREPDESLDLTKHGPTPG